MNAAQIAAALGTRRYDFTDLGDGTGVLASLETGKMVTLNELATSVVKVLLEADGVDPHAALDELATAVADTHGIERERVATDISAFLDSLSEQIGQG